MKAARERPIATNMMASPATLNVLMIDDENKRTPIKNALLFISTVLQQKAPKTQLLLKLALYQESEDTVKPNDAPPFQRTISST